MRQLLLLLVPLLLKPFQTLGDVIRRPPSPSTKRKLSPDKHKVERADPDDCTGLSYDEDDDPHAHHIPCRRSPIDEDDLDLPPNRLTVPAYFGIPPGKKAIGPLVTFALAERWDESLDNMNFFLDETYEKQYKRDDNDDDDDDSRSLTTTHADERTTNGNITERVGLRGYRLKPRRKAQVMREQVFDMFHTQSDTILLKKYNLRWWWQVNMTYECFWEDDQDVVGEKMMARIRENMTNAFTLVRPDLQEMIQKAKQDAAIRIRTEEQGMPNATFDNNDKDVEKVSTAAPLETKVWDWRRYLGLGLFAGTLGMTLFLRFLAARRQKQQEVQQVWVNLASREGMDQLLNTGWALEGSKMQIYDKTKAGYNDDDSLFLGGFEQREAAVGTEITVTHPETSETQAAPSHLSSRSPSHLVNKE